MLGKPPSESVDWSEVGPLGRWPGGVAVEDRHGRYLYTNQVFASFLGYTSQELSGRSHLEFSAEDDGLLSTNTDRRAWSRPLSAVGSLTRYRRKDGRLVWARVHVDPIRGQSGEPEGFVLYIEDWTDRQAEQDLLADSLSLFETAQECGGIGTFVAWLTPDKVGVDEWSKTCMEIFGYDETTYDGTNEAFWRRIHPDDLEMVREAQRLAHETGSYYDVQHRIVRPDGVVRWVRERARVEHTDDGIPLRFLGVTMDITKDRLQEEALRASEADFKGAFESAAIGTVIAGLDGAVRRTNGAVTRILGRPQESLVGQSLADFAYPEDVPHLPTIVSMIAQERDVESFTQRLRHAEGHEIWVRINRSVIRDADGAPRHVITQVEDVTAFLAARAELDEARAEAQARERVTAMLNHEIGNPVNAVLGFVQLLRDGSPGPLTDKQRLYLENLSTAATQLHELVGEALEMSRISSSVFEVKAVPVRLGDQLYSALNQAQPLAAAKGSRLSMECPEDVLVAADPHRLLQVLRNLVGNAIKHTPGGTSILVVGRTHGNHAEIAVADDGEGIPPDELERIFDEFVQVGPDRSGTGLGLAICRQLTQLMGGELSVSSTLGEGTRFAFTLPLAEGPGPAQQGRAGRRPRPRARRARGRLAGDLT